MPIIKSNQITIIDNSTNVNLELFVSSNLPTSQVLNTDNVINPSWAITPLVLTPTVYVNNKLVSNPSISWQRRSGGGAYTGMIDGETISNGVLTVNKNILMSDANKIITYKCIVKYGTVTHYAELTYSLNVIGADGKDGSSVSILGTAYIAEEITECIIGQNYTLYSDAGLTNKITGSKKGDAYLVNGHLFVYSGAENDQFNCVGNIKGVGITSITGPAPNGNIDTYTIHYSDGTTSTYDIANGKSVYITYNDSITQPSAPTGNGTTNGWHTDMTNTSVWISQKVSDSVTSGTWGTPVRIRAIDGENGVTFSIYSETGTVFHDEDEITLKLNKLDGATNIAISGTTKLQWSKFVNNAWINTWKYDTGDTTNVVTTGETLLIKHSEVNGSQLYRCVMTYKGRQYSAFITITDKTDIYQTKIISVGGNILHGGEQGIVAYATLFKGAVEEDSLLYPIYEQGTIPIANEIYYVVDNGQVYSRKYVNNAWINDDTSKQLYSYSWFILDNYTGEQRAIGEGKVIYIPNDIISSSAIVQCRVADLSVGTEIFMDANDPIISAEQPISTTSGQLWFNTSNNVLYVYNSTSTTWEPVNAGQNRTYLSAPINEVDGYYYHAGDLWIVDSTDTAYTNATAGTLLIAVNGFDGDGSSFSAADWKTKLANDWDNKLYYDAEINKIVDYQNKLSAYVNFEIDGMKIGATNTEFYTKITPYDLGFYQGVEKVAYIGNNKMYNTSLEVSNDIQIVSHKSNTQSNPQKPSLGINNYKFIIEENNSMSIAYSLLSAPQPSVIRYAISSSAFAIYFGPWSTNNAYGYRSNWDTTTLEKIKLFTVDGNEIPTTKTYAETYIRMAASSALPSIFIAQIPAHSVYNQGVSGNTLGYDTTDVGNDAITLTINK